MNRKSQPQDLNPSQHSFMHMHASDLQRLGMDVLKPESINARCSKLTWKKAFHANVIERVSDGADCKPRYRVKRSVWRQVRDHEFPTLPCGCTDFTNTGDGYECSCGTTHDRETVEAYLERVP